jgi:hypothetical protein
MVAELLRGVTRRTCPLAGVSSTDCGVTKVHSTAEPSLSSSPDDDESPSSVWCAVPSRSSHSTMGCADMGVAGGAGDATDRRALDLAGSSGGGTSKPSGDARRAAVGEKTARCGPSPGDPALGGCCCAAATSRGVARSAGRRRVSWAIADKVAAVTLVEEEEDEGSDFVLLSILTRRGDCGMRSFGFVASSRCRNCSCRGLCETGEVGAEK